MDIFQAPMGMFATCTAVLGVALFAAAPFMPSLFPASVVRLLGVFGVCTSMCLLWALSDLPREAWKAPAIVGGAALALIIIITLVQMRQPHASADVPEAEPPTVDSDI